MATLRVKAAIGSDEQLDSLEDESPCSPGPLFWVALFFATDLFVALFLLWWRFYFAFTAGLKIDFALNCPLASSTALIRGAVSAEQLIRWNAS